MLFLLVKEMIALRFADHHDERIVRYINTRNELVNALEDLVSINEQHNAAIGKIMGAPAGWKDSYLDKARAALAKARGES
jgi:hypothetical protein